MDSDSYISPLRNTHYEEISKVIERLWQIQLKITLIEAKLAAKATIGDGRKEGGMLAKWRKTYMNSRKESQ